MISATLERARREARARIIPPQRRPLSEWIEENLYLPQDVADIAGRVELWPFQPEIANAMSDPDIEKITLVKPTRVGFTTLLTGFVASHVANDPAPIGLYLPTEDDCRDHVVATLEPIFDASPTLSGLLLDGTDERGRNTLLHRTFPGGSLRVLAAKSPRNFRAKNFRIVIFDEADAMEPTTEGNPIDLGTKRTDSFRNRKIIIGSTPVHADTSNVLRSYATSDRRIYEIPCIHCGAMFELLWKHIHFERGRPETAQCVCPHCNEGIEERYKAEMVSNGAWRALAPEVEGHAGFKFNSLVSLLPNTTWRHLATEWMEKHKDPDTLQVFINTRLAEGWREEGEDLSSEDLAKRVEHFALAADAETEREGIPKEVLALTAGIDVQKDRMEVGVFGHGRPVEVKGFLLPTLYVMDHTIIWGDPEDNTTYNDLWDYLRRKWQHPLGAQIGISAAAIDSGNWSDVVYDFAFPRFGHRVIAIKGQAGAARRALEPSKSRKTSKGGSTGRIHIVATDFMKKRIFQRLQLPGAIRFSSAVLDDRPDYFEQLTAERKVLRMIGGQPVWRFERKQSHLPNEALAVMMYGWAALDLVPADYDAWERRLSVMEQKQKRSLSSFAAVRNGGNNG